MHDFKSHRIAKSEYYAQSCPIAEVVGTYIGYVSTFFLGYALRLSTQKSSSYIPTDPEVVNAGLDLIWHYVIYRLLLHTS